jgi:hypothetical protein
LNVNVDYMSAAPDCATAQVHLCDAQPSSRRAEVHFVISEVDFRDAAPRPRESRDDIHAVGPGVGSAETRFAMERMHFG